MLRTVCFQHSRPGDSLTEHQQPAFMIWKLLGPELAAIVPRLQAIIPENELREAEEVFEDIEQAFV